MIDISTNIESQPDILLYTNNNHEKENQNIKRKTKRGEKLPRSERRRLKIKTLRSLVIKLSHQSRARWSEKRTVELLPVLQANVTLTFIMMLKFPCSLCFSLSPICIFGHAKSAKTDHFRDRHLAAMVVALYGF